VYGRVAGLPERFLRRLIDLEAAVWGDVMPTMVFLVRRKEPLRKEPEHLWLKWKSEYETLCGREGRRYPVTAVENDGSIPAAMERIGLALGWTQPDDHAAGAPTVFSSISPAKPTEVYDTFWTFAVERQRVFFRRLRQQPPPWTDDHILREFKFTNAYRASDRVSQYLIRNVVFAGDQDPREVFFRILIFKLFNKIETWDMLVRALGGITYREYAFKEYDRVLTRAMAAGQTIYSGAYIMPSGHKSFPSKRKHGAHLKLAERLMQDDVAHRLADSRRMKDGFDLLRSYPMIGDFLAYQFITDINYSDITRYGESEFVVPGPGARDGIRKCFASLGGLTEADIIRVVAEMQEAEFARLGLEFSSLWGRRLQFIDCQNLFCEVDKYARVRHPNAAGRSGRTRIKQRFRPRSAAIEYWYPPRWQINEAVAATLGERRREA
jgi:hypothetical protein